MLPKNMWKFGQGGWGTVLALTGKPQGEVRKPGPTGTVAALPGRWPWSGQVTTLCGRGSWHRPVQMPTAL